MPCGRESRCAGAWRLRPLERVLMIVLFSVMPRGAVSRELGLPPEATIKRNMTSNSIPYPFGVRGRSIPGFEVTCGPNKEAMLPIGKHSYVIHDVSVQGGFVVLILAGDISQVCYDRNGTRMRTTGIGDISLEQTPFSIIGAGGYHRMILDWAVGRGTCDQASQHNLDRRYCNHMSGCIDAPNGAGHLCKCNAGYDGNPYAADGCLDIDECRALGSNNCTFPILCHNTDGGFTCPCPLNWPGDGYKTGTGCNPSGTPART